MIPACSSLMCFFNKGDIRQTIFFKTVGSLYAKDHLSCPTARNTFVLKTAYRVGAFKNSWQISYMVCTKQMVSNPFHNLLLVQVHP